MRFWCKNPYSRRTQELELLALAIGFFVTLAVLRYLWY